MRFLTAPEIIKLHHPNLTSQSSLNFALKPRSVERFDKIPSNRSAQSSTCHKGTSSVTVAFFLLLLHAYKRWLFLALLFFVRRARIHSQILFHRLVSKPVPLQQHRFMSPCSTLIATLRIVLQSLQSWIKTRSTARARHVASDAVKVARVCCQEAREDSDWL